MHVSKEVAGIDARDLEDEDVKDGAVFQPSLRNYI
jgi:hypothetical protein